VDPRDLNGDSGDAMVWRTLTPAGVIRARYGIEEAAPDAAAVAAEIQARQSGLTMDPSQTAVQGPIRTDDAIRQQVTAANTRRNIAVIDIASTRPEPLRALDVMALAQQTAGIVTAPGQPPSFQGDPAEMQAVIAARQALTGRMGPLDGTVQ
jgi:hypothetical protein